MGCRWGPRAAAIDDQSGGSFRKPSGSVPKASQGPECASALFNYDSVIGGHVSRRALRPVGVRARSTVFLLPAWFSPTSSLRVAFHRMRGVRIGRDVEIGYFVILDNLYPEKIVIDDGATVAARATVLAHDEALAYARNGAEEVLQTHIGSRAFVGVHSVIMPGVTVGAGAIVGAGSVVTKDVPAGATVAGVPAKGILPKQESEPELEAP